MNKFLVVVLLFTLSNCMLKFENCKIDTVAPDILIDTTSKDYQYNYEFDWTDDDHYSFKVPFVYNFNKDEIIPFFVNASYSLPSSRTVDANNKIKIDEQEIATLNEFKAYGQKVFATFENYDIKSNTLTVDLKANDLKADNNDITRKFIKYFGYAYCDSKNIYFEKSNILATFNNGNYFSISKILLISLALLFL